MSLNNPTQAGLVNILNLLKCAEVSIGETTKDLQTQYQLLGIKPCDQLSTKLELVIEECSTSMEETMQVILAGESFIEHLISMLEEYDKVEL